MRKEKSTQHYDSDGAKIVNHLRNWQDLKEYLEAVYGKTRHNVILNVLNKVREINHVD